MFLHATPTSHTPAQLPLPCPNNAVFVCPPPPPQLMDQKEREFLRAALANYTRCLCTGDGYDLRVVFRIVQLWLR